MENKEIIVEGKPYSFVRSRNHMPVSVYKGDGVYLRIGPKEFIGKELEYHKKLLDFGVPLAEIMKNGECQYGSYFIEKTLGDFHFGQLFAEDFEKNGFISDAIFQKFMNIVKKYAEAQLKTVSAEKFNRKNFEELFHFEMILKEAPDFSEKSKACAEKVANHVSGLPMVITHGDFNPHNIFPDGVIDWERVTLAPVGYDLATNISHIFFFPREDGYEYRGKYVFSKSQIAEYWNEIDKIYASRGLPAISKYADDFIFCRSVWCAARMKKFPKLQKWRYDLHEKIMDAYLHGESLMELITANK